MSVAEQRAARRSSRGEAANGTPIPPRVQSVLNILAHTGDGVFAVDPHQRIILWNTAAERLLGWRASDVLGKPCHEVLAGRMPTGDARCTADCEDIRCAERGDIIPTYDLVTRTRDGREIWLNVTIFTVGRAGRHGPVAVHVVRDLGVERRLDAWADRLVGALRDRLGAAPEMPMLPVSDAPAPDMTPRERDVLRLLARGMATRAIAAELFISPATVRNHVQNILSKVHAHSRLEAVARAIAGRLL